MDTLAPTYVEKSAETTGSAAERAEKKKTNHYGILLDRYVFVPLAFETYDAWGSEAKLFFEELGAKLAFQTGEPR